jgi:hypothetical protein
MPSPPNPALLRPQKERSFAELTEEQKAALIIFQQDTVEERKSALNNKLEAEKLMREREKITESKQLLEESLEEHEIIFYFESLRWLRSTDWKVQKSVDNYKKAVQWRNKWNVDSILNNRPAKLDLNRKVCPHANVGIAKDGSPAFFERTGSCHVEALLSLLDEKNKEVLINHVYDQEDLTQICLNQSKATGSWIDQSTQVLDMTGLGVTHRRAVRFVIDIMTTDQLYYPESMRALYCINCPRIFPVLYAIVKPFLDKKTVSKIVVLSGNATPELLKVFDAQQLPDCYGGTLPTPEALKITEAKELNDYLKNQVAMGNEELIKTEVKAGKKFEKILKCSKKNSTFAWYFKIEKGSDIGFSASFKPLSASPTDKAIVVIAAERKNSDFATSGDWTAEEAGEMIFTLDNSYSYFKTKQLHYYFGCEDEPGEEVLSPSIENPNNDPAAHTNPKESTKQAAEEEEGAGGITFHDATENKE